MEGSERNEKDDGKGLETGVMEGLERSEKESREMSERDLEIEGEKGDQ